MIHKNPYGVSPTLEIVIGNVEIDYATINFLELHLAENQHDLLVMEMSGIPPRAILDYYNKPVSVSISTGGNYSQKFYGYVEDVRPESVTGFGLMNGSPFQTAKIVCLGASYVMRGSTSFVWNRYRLSDIARDLANKYSFSLDVVKDPAIHESLVQTNESDWQFLTRYATFLGYSVNVHGTHMHLYDPYKALSRQNSYHVLSTLRKKDNNSLRPMPGQVMEFSGSFSKRHIDGEYNESIVTVVQPDNRMFNVTSRTVAPTNNGVPRFPNRVAEYTDNFEEAARRISSVSKEKYDYYATAKVIGVAGCKPGGIVRLDNYDTEFDGFWYVQSVKHTVHSNAFFSELELAKNVNSELVFTNTEPMQRPPETAYSSRFGWVAETKRIHEYS
jgi:phage protein D